MRSRRAWSTPPPEHEAHDLRGGTEDLHLVSVFNPPITGDEKHTLSEDGYSSY